ncbi:16S rRNA (uracil(1498)-N(3))-methyltransferase [Nigerium massiliense]|uniref:16S rRNA (uracil(1498)-N(3))-methyltransferase n=1 Tax=Nigerium massiliense TaxID=1522317 RepID=UPI00059043B1|nr:16S rRNA (uracil(1498)-N(3))-methyltransferase [Nigerium massiliense]
MTDALFLAELDSPQVGDEVTVSGDEGRHAVSVRRIRVGETVLVADGAGTAVRGPVTSTERSAMTLTVDEVLHTPQSPLRLAVAQGLAKGDRAELAVETMTELGVDEIVPWPAARSIVKWDPERAQRGLTRWRAAAREATKQSRRYRVPTVGFPSDTGALVQRIPQTALTLVLHEDAEVGLADVELPASGEILMIVGPEGGIAPEELDAFTKAGGVPVSISDGVLRTSTAGVAALAQVRALLAARR